MKPSSEIDVALRAKRLIGWADFFAKRGDDAVLNTASLRTLLREAAALLTRETRRADDAERDAKAVRELMNVYNLGGWTDAVAPMKRALDAETALAEARADADRLRAIVVAADNAREWEMMDRRCPSPWWDDYDRAKGKES